MRKPLFTNPSYFGRIPDPPEREQECCGNCKHNCYEKKDTFTCSNEESRYYASYTAYDDCCDAYEAKEDYSSLNKLSQEFSQGFSQGRRDMLVIENCNSLSDLRQKLIDGEEVRTARYEPCEDAISRQAVLDKKELVELEDGQSFYCISPEDVETLPPVIPQPKIGHCKDCKWWKDTDGAFRRGIGAESQCPINREEVFEGNGYCYLFEPKESEIVT